MSPVPIFKQRGTISGSRKVSAPSGPQYYVATTANGGNDNTGNGSSGAPWSTLKKACDTVTSGTINLGSGIFTEATTCTLPNGVSLVGTGVGTTTVRCGSNFTPLLLVQNVSGPQTISDLTLDGQARAVGGYGLLVNGATNLIVTRVESKGWRGPDGGACIRIDSATDCEFSYLTVTNGGDKVDYYTLGGAMGMRTGTRVKIHHCTVTNDRAYAFKVPQSGVWTDCEVYNCTFSVSGDNPQDYYGSGNPSGIAYQHYLTYECFSTVALRNRIYNNLFDGIVSLTGPGQNPSIGNPKTNGGTYRWRLHNNRWNITNGGRYGIEISNHSMQIDHNYFTGGIYPLGYFEGSALSDDWVHHNVFDANTYTAPLTHVVTSMAGAIYEKNTVISRQTSWPFFNISAASNCQIRDNVFWATSSQGDKLATAAMISGSTIDNNSFDNITAKGTNTKSGAGLTLSGFPNGYHTGLAGIGAFADGDFTVGVQ